MLLTRTSTLSGITRTRELNVTQEQLDRIDAGEKIQRVCKHLSDDDREFILTGSSAEEWDAAFAEE